jgi:hypothetical protein
MYKQSSKVNVRKYNQVNRGVKCCSVYSFYCSVYSFYCSVYPIVLSDIHFTPLFNPLYCLTFTLLLCLHHCIVWHSLYGSVEWIKKAVKWINRAVKWINRALKWINRALKWINRAVKWINRAYTECQTTQWGKQSSKVNISFYCSVYSFDCFLYSFDCSVYSFYCSVYSFYCSVYSFYCSVYPILLSDIEQ